jgi:outer membrane receptor protein involved in Fe transport
MTDNVTVLVGFNNVLNEEPPLDLSDGNSSQPFYNQSFHNLTGREFYIEGQFSF